MATTKKPMTLTFDVTPYYRCTRCDMLLDEEGERRCEDCNRYGARVDVILICPHCDEAITTEDV